MSQESRFYVNFLQEELPSVLKSNKITICDENLLTNFSLNELYSTYTLKMPIVTLNALREF